MRWNTTGITVAGASMTPGLGTNLLNKPIGLIIDSNVTIYVADTYNNRAQRWPKGATFGTAVAGQLNGTSGSSSTVLQLPQGLVVDSNSNVYVADTVNHRIQLWLVGATAGTTVAGTGNR